MNIKTVTTVDGVNEICFSQDDTHCIGSNYYWLKNIGTSDVYVSADSGIEADGDNTALLAAGEMIMLVSGNRTIYVLGEGKIEIHEGSKSTCPFKSATSPSGVGGVSGTSIRVQNSAEFPLLALNLYGKSTQNGTPTPDAPVDIVSAGDDGSLAVMACGKNLYEGSQDWSGAWTHKDKWESADETYLGLTVMKRSEAWYGVRKNIWVEGGKTYTFSCFAKYAESDGVKVQMDANYGGTAEPSQSYFYITPSTEWRQFKIVFRCTKSGFVNPRVEKIQNDTNALYICGYQLEEGNTAPTEWAGSGFDTTGYEPYTGGTASLASVLPLCGLPVTSGGNYTDRSGQQWICDELIYRADGTGKVIKNCVKFVPDTVSGFTLLADGTTFRISFVCPIPHGNALVKRATLCSHALYDADWVKVNCFCYLMTNGVTNKLLLQIPAALVTEATLTGAQEWLDNNEVVFVYALATPEEIELTADEVEQLKQLYSYNGVTNVFNDEGTEMVVKYCNSPLISEVYLPVVKAALSYGANI